MTYVKAMPQADYKEQFLARVKEAREASGLSQEGIGRLLGISQTRYSKYEVRTLLPHHFVVRFCDATRCEITWLFTGKRLKARHLVVHSRGGKSATAPS